MCKSIEKWDRLLAQSRRGDMGARAELLEQTRPSIHFVARRALRTRNEILPVTRLVHAAAQQAWSEGPRQRAGKRPTFMSRITGHVLDSIIHGVRAQFSRGFRMKETVRL